MKNNFRFYVLWVKIKEVLGVLNFVIHKRTQQKTGVAYF